MTDPRSFGAWLARERDRRGIALQAVASRTKIGTSRLAALERGDVSHWPGGIYRRAFVKAYADVVGLDADLVLANFEQAFPDPDAPPVPSPPRPAGELRLVFEPQAMAAGAPMAAWRRVGIYLAAACAAGLVGWLVAGSTGLWCATTVVALTAHIGAELGWHSRWRAGAKRMAAAVGGAALPLAWSAISRSRRWREL